ncbi:MAG: NAD-binding protein [Gammaproteobacteria bacterium]|nr:NAD-binding protein [Gammaproteobacteria bacterium]
MSKTRLETQAGNYPRKRVNFRLADDRLLDVGRATIAIIGMGCVGTGAYDTMCRLNEESVVGVDIDPLTVHQQQSTGRNVLLGDPTDADFWDRVQAAHTLELVMLTLPNASTNLAVLEQLAAASFSGHVVATAKFPDEVDALKSAGATTVFNFYVEAGAGFAEHVITETVNNRREGDE